MFLFFYFQSFFEIHFYDVYKDKIVIAQREGFVIDIFDSGGKLLHSIKHKVKAVPFTKTDKEDAVKYWREERGYEQSQIDILLERTDFPDYFPPIQTCQLADGKIYVITYRRKDNKNECLIFDMQGKFLKRTFIKLKTAVSPWYYPYTIYNDKMYYLSENEGTEETELHIEDIE